MPKIKAPKIENGLTAAARRITEQKTGSVFAGNNKTTGAEWQGDAWAMFDAVGELRFVVNAIAGQLAKAHLFVAEVNEDGEVIKTENAEARKAMTLLGSSFANTSQLLDRLAQNLLVTGEAWFAGVPPLGDNGKRKSMSDVNLYELDWSMLSISEVARENKKVTLKNGVVDEELKMSDVHLVRIHDPHPRKYNEAISPVRSALPILKELVGLTMHISAQIDSRLAGAGVFVVPKSAQQSMQQNVLASAYGQDVAANDIVTESLIESMSTPLADRGSASAIVPLVISAPDEAVGKFQHISFASTLDGQAENLRDESIRRLALALDIPPEMLTGTADMNHWSSWLISEDTISNHIEPLLSLIVDALTQQFLGDMLEALGVPDPDKYFVWYSVDHMKARPNRSAEALSLYQSGLVSEQAAREANGFEESSKVSNAYELVLSWVNANTALLANPGTPALLQQAEALLEQDARKLAQLPDTAGGSATPAMPSSGMQPVTLPDSAPGGDA